MKIGVISDTHGNTTNTQKAVDLLKKHQVETVLHCGDVCGDKIVELLADWPTHFVAGNCDSEKMLELAVQQAKQHWHGLFGEIELAGRRIALLHSHVPGKLMQASQEGLYDLICYGHTHVAESHYVGKTLVFNPGALHRANPHRIAVINLETMSIESLVL